MAHDDPWGDLSGERRRKPKFPEQLAVPDLPDLAFWQALYPEGQQGAWRRPRPLRSHHPLLFFSSTSPLPSAVHFGTWQWFTTPRELASYLRFVWLPDTIRERARLPTDGPLRPSNEVLAQANGWQDEDFARSLDARLAGAVDDERSWAAIDEVVARVNDKWGRTHSWDHRLEVFRNLQEAALPLYHRVAQGEWSGAEELDHPEDRRDQQREIRAWVKRCASIDTGWAAELDIATCLQEGDEY